MVTVLSWSKSRGLEFIRVEFEAVKIEEKIKKKENKPVKGCMPNVESEREAGGFRIEGFKRKIRFVLLYAWESVTKGFRVSVKKDRAGFLTNGLGGWGLREEHTLPWVSPERIKPPLRYRGKNLSLLKFYF